MLLCGSAASQVWHTTGVREDLHFVAGRALALSGQLCLAPHTPHTHTPLVVSAWAQAKVPLLCKVLYPQAGALAVLHECAWACSSRCIKLVPGATTLNSTANLHKFLSMRWRTARSAGLYLIQLQLQVQSCSSDERWHQNIGYPGQYSKCTHLQGPGLRLYPQTRT